MTDRLTPNRYGTPPEPEKQLSTAEKFAHFIEDLGLPQTPDEPAQLPAPEQPRQTTPQDRAQAFGAQIQGLLDAQDTVGPFGYIDAHTGRPGTPVTD